MKLATMKKLARILELENMIATMERALIHKTTKYPAKIESRIKLNQQVIERLRAELGFNK